MLQVLDALLGLAKRVDVRLCGLIASQLRSKPCVEPVYPHQAALQKRRKAPNAFSAWIRASRSAGCRTLNLSDSCPELPPPRLAVFDTAKETSVISKE